MKIHHRLNLLENDPPDALKHGYVALFIGGMEHRPRWYSRLHWRVQGNNLLVSLDHAVQWNAQCSGAAEVIVYSNPITNDQAICWFNGLTANKGDVVQFIGGAN